MLQSNRTPHRSLGFRLVYFVGCVLVFCACEGPNANTAAESADGEQASAEAPGVRYVVWILLDACRADHLSCYGYERNTSPNIDALTNRGALFERNYAQAPATLLSVPSYMTGRLEPVSYQDPGSLELWYLKKPHANEVLVSTVFSVNDFETAMFSASPWYSSESALGKSFDTFEWLDHGRVAEAGSYEQRNPRLFKWLEAHASEPFFLYVHSLDTHSPRYTNNTEETWLDPTFPEARDAELRAWRGSPFNASDREHIRNLYDGGVSYADSTVGALVAKFESLGILDETLLVISSDHGEVLAQDGRTLGHPDTDSSGDVLHTPLIMAGPGVPRGVRVSAKTQNADIVPTLIDLLSVKTDGSFDGVSLTGLLNGSAPETIHEYVYARTRAFTLISEPNRILVYDDMKFDFNPHTPETIDLLGLKRKSLLDVWAVPDPAGARRAIQASTDRIEEARSEIEQKFVPMWQAKQALPIDVPPVFFVRHKTNLTKDSITNVDSRTDDLWEHRKPPMFGDPLYEKDLLIAHPSTEKPSALDYGNRVPDGTYQVSVLSSTLGGADSGRQVSFSFWGEGDTDFRVFTLAPGVSAQANMQWFDVGAYTISNGFFSYRLDVGNPDDVAVVGSLRFVRAGMDLDSAYSKDEQEVRLERLRALGYIQ